MSSIMRDSQKSKLYRSERVVLKGMEDVGMLEIIDDISDLRGAVDDTWNAIGLSHYRPPKVGWLSKNAKRLGAWYNTGSHEVRFNRGTRAASQLIVCHELTHAAMSVDVLCGRAAWHGPEFATKYLKAVEATMGFDLAGTLRKSMILHGVRRAA